MFDNRRRTDARGYSIAELTLVLAIIGIVTATATPMFLSYAHAARLRVAAEEVAAFLNQGRQLGIRENVGVCVHITSTAMHYTVGSTCGAGTVWLGAGTDAAGNIPLPEGVTVTATAEVQFSYLGAANPGATYTVTDTHTSQTLRVIVAPSGRVCVTKSGNCA